MPEAAVHVASGKVRELYALDDDRLLLVASDRISTFDVVLPTEIPDKGRVLTGLSGFWFAQTRDDRPEPPARAARRRPLDRVPAARDAADRVRRPRLPRRLGLEGLPRDRRGLRPPACRPGSPSPTALPEPIFTPATKAQTGHDENIDRAAAVELVGEERFDEAERLTLELYRFVVGARARARDHPRRHEARVRRRPGRPARARRRGVHARLVALLARRRATRPGGAQPSFDKQFVRDYCESLGWDKTLPRPGAPRRRRRRDARPLRRGVRAPDRDRVRRLRRRARTWCSGEGDRARPPEGGDPRPAGPGGRERPPAPRLRRRPRPRRPARRARAPDRATSARRAPRSSGCASSCSRTR